MKKVKKSSDLKEKNLKSWQPEVFEIPNFGYSAGEEARQLEPLEIIRMSLSALLEKLSLLQPETLDIIQDIEYIINDYIDTQLSSEFVY